MNENNFSNLPPNAEKPEKKVINNEADLILLFNHQLLTKEKINEAAGKLEMKAVTLCYRILGKMQEVDNFGIYSNQLGQIEIKTESDLRDGIFSFLEKIQKERSAVSEAVIPSVKSDESSVQNEEPIHIEKEEPSTVNPDIDSVPEEEPAPIDEPVRIETGEIQPVVHSDLPTGDWVTEPEQPIEESTQPDIEPASEPAQQDDAVAEKPELPEDVSRPEKQDWWEVKRETEVMAIEDLDGDMDMFREHVVRLGVAEEGLDGSWKWTGGDRKLIFLGDILGDREMNGIQITSNIGSLAEQAKEAGGQVDSICGNHDILFINFLCHEFSDKSVRMQAESILKQYIGILELALTNPDPNSEFRMATLTDWYDHAEELIPLLNARMPAILENMKTDPEGKKLLENICNLKVAVVYDDTLYCHTDPTGAMMADLTKGGDIAGRVSEVNEIFQESLRKKIFEGVPFNDEFKSLENIYLNTDNRSYFTEKEEVYVILDDLYERLHLDMKELEVSKFVDEWKKKYALAGEYVSQVQHLLIEKNAGNLERAVQRSNDIFTGIVFEHVNMIRNARINAIIHGHSPTPGRYYNENDLVIVSPHSHFHAPENKVSGVLTLKTNGKIELFGQSFREKRPEEGRGTSEKPKVVADPTSESLKKFSGLFSTFELSYDAIKKEADEKKVTPKDLALSFVNSIPELKTEFETKLNALPADKRDDKAVEKLVLTVLFEEEDKKTKKQLEAAQENISKKDQDISVAKNNQEKMRLEAEKETLKNEMRMNKRKSGLIWADLLEMSNL